MDFDVKKMTNRQLVVGGILLALGGGGGGVSVVSIYEQFTADAKLLEKIMEEKEDREKAITTLTKQFHRQWQVVGTLKDRVSKVEARQEQ